MKRFLLTGWAPHVAGLAGLVLVFGLGFYFNASMEAQKAAEQRKFEAVSTFLRFAWGNDDPKDQLAYTRSLSQLAAFGPPELLAAVRDYQADAECGGDDTRLCQQRWARVIAETRAFIGASPIAEDLIIDIVYGAGGS